MCCVPVLVHQEKAAFVSDGVLDLSRSLKKDLGLAELPKLSGDGVHGFHFK
jgi:hypothetical protein